MNLIERFKKNTAELLPDNKQWSRFNEAILKRLDNALASQSRSISGLYNQINLRGFGYVMPDKTNENSISEGYLSNDSIYSIIKLITRSCSFAPWGVYKVEDESSYKKYNALLKKGNNKDYKEISDLRVKALKLDESHYLNGVLANPNDEQGESEYIENLLGYKLITGNGYEFGMRSEINGLGTLKKGMPTKLYVMPSHLMRIVTDGNFPVSVVAYYMQLERVIEFSTDDILHTKYWNPKYSFLGNHLYGLSPLEAAWKVLLTDNEIQDSSYEQAYNKTVRGILSYEPPAGMDLSNYNKIGSKNAGIIQDRWEEMQREYRNKIIISLLKANYTKIGLSANDISSLNESNYTLAKLANLYGVPDRLLNSGNDASYNNYEQDNIRLITKVCLPELNQLKDARNKMFQKSWGLKGSGYVIDYDPTVFTELQENRKDQVDFLKDAWWLSPNEKRNYMDEALIEGEEMNKIYVPTNLQPIDKANLQQTNTDQNVQDQNNRPTI